MLVVIQRVTSSYVKVEKSIIGCIDKGLVCLVCAVPNDTLKTIEKVADKISKLRIFNDANGKMNKSVIDIGGSVLIISQFTLAANTARGNRPDFRGAMQQKEAKFLFEYLVKTMKDKKIKIETGVFGANMKLMICNDGPVTISLNIE